MLISSTIRNDILVEHEEGVCLLQNEVQDNVQSEDEDEEVFIEVKDNAKDAIFSEVEDADNAVINLTHVLPRQTSCPLMSSQRCRKQWSGASTSRFCSSNKRSIAVPLFLRNEVETIANCELSPEKHFIGNRVGNYFGHGELLRKFLWES